jgi:universal stress protein A
MLMRRVLVPVDFSPRSRAALDYAFRLAELAQAEVEVLHVVPAPGQTRAAVDVMLGRAIPHASPLEVFDARQRLQELIAGCDRRGLVPRLRVEAGDAAATIVRVGAELPADAIVIGTRGHRGLSELFLGSVAHRVITCATCPVVTLGGHRDS